MRSHIISETAKVAILLDIYDNSLDFRNRYDFISAGFVGYLYDAIQMHSVRFYRLSLRSSSCAIWAVFPIKIEPAVVLVELLG